MKYSKVNIWIVILSMVGALALAACDTGGPPATPSTPTTAPTPSAAPTTQPVPTIEPTSPVSVATIANTREAVATSEPSAGWQTFTASDGAFSVDMPGQPTESTQPASGGTTAYIYTVSKGSDSYVISFTDLPASAGGFTPKQLLDSARDGAATSSGGELVEEKDITLGEYPGRDFTLKVELLNTNIRQRAYLVRSRLYQLVTTGPGNNVNSEDAERFFNSFTVVGPTSTSVVIPTAGGGDTGGDWQTFTSQDGGFSVEMPGEPVVGSQSVPAGTETMEVHTFSLSREREKESYTMTYSDFPAAALQAGAIPVLEGALRGAAAQGTLVNQESITVDGNPGIQGEFEVPGTGYSWYKAVIVEERMYQLIVIAQSKDATTQNARRFLDSFKLAP